MKNLSDIDKQINTVKEELTALKVRKAELQDRINRLQGLKQSIADEQLPFNQKSESYLTNESTDEQKIIFFRSLFRGREDVYPRRFESKRTGKSGYQPVCRKEWIRPFCQKPKIKCGNCENRDFTPLSDDVIRNHLIGNDPADRYRREFLIGVVDDIVAKYGYLVVDECHHISARSFEIVARQCKAKYVTGLSATVTRKDGHHPNF